MTGGSLRSVRGVPQQRCPDISTAKCVLHWDPRVGFEEALRLTLTYFKQQVAAAS